MKPQFILKIEKLNFQYRFKSLLVGIAFFFHLGLSAPGLAMENQSSNSLEFVPGEVIVKFKASKKSLNFKAEIQTLLNSKFGGLSGVRPFQMDQSLVLVTFAKRFSVSDVIRELKSNDNVIFAEPNYIYSTFDGETPNDPDFSKTWGLHNTGQADSGGHAGLVGADINVLPLWQAGFKGGRQVLVAVIDTGIDWSHPDLIDNLYTNPGEAGELATNGKDDDGNGFIDDAHGWNFENNTRNSRDDNRHGTHVAGTIGGVGNNGIGVTGVNWEVSLLPVKFLDAGGSGTLAAAVESIKYATKMRAHIMSNSWGGGGFSQALKDCIEEAKSAGILFVAAAGNSSSNNDTTPAYPASYQIANVVAVAATDNDDKIASFSNYGAQKVHVAAPGVRVYSSVTGGGYDSFSGTSMATPHVSGIAALLLAAKPELTFDIIKDRLIKTSDIIPGLKKKVLARGRVNTFNAFFNIVPPSDEPPESAWKDVLFTLESPHPYNDNSNIVYDISHPGAQYLRVHFEKIDMENRYDFVSIETDTGTSVEEITDQATNKMSEYVKSDKLKIRLKSDGSVVGWGFKINRIQVIVPPTHFTSSNRLYGMLSMR